MSAHPIPKTALAQHVVVLGKTRSGKSSTMRLMVEGLLFGRASPVALSNQQQDQQPDRRSPRLTFR